METCGSSRLLAAIRRVVCGLVGVACAAVFLGCLFHTSSDNRVLGKYSPWHVVTMGILVALTVPLILFVRFLLSVSTRRLPDGRTVHFRPRFKLVFFAVLLALVVTPFEVYVRRHPDLLVRPTTIDEAHPFLQARPAPNDPRLTVNSHGFRGEEIERRKPPGTFRIFVLGGSTVFSQEVDFEETHCRLLEMRLREHFPDRRIEVMNAGYIWYTTEHSLINYCFKVKDFEPDMVIMWHGINDLCRSFSPPDYAYGAVQPDYAHYFGPSAKWVFPYFRRQDDGPVVEVNLKVVDLVVQRATMTLFSDRRPVIASPRTTPVAVTDFPSLRSFTRNLRTLIETIRHDGVTLVLCTQPSVYRKDLRPAARDQLWFPHVLCASGDTHPDVESMASGMAQFNDAMKRLAAEYGVPLVDLDANLAKSWAYFLDDVHYSKAGSAVVGKVLGDAVISGGYLERAAASPVAADAGPPAD